MKKRKSKKSSGILGQPSKSTIPRRDLVDQVGDEDLLFADGFDKAIIGVSLGREQKVVYDYDACITILMKDMSYEEAVEFFDYNTLDSYVGERTPVFIKRMT